MRCLVVKAHPLSESLCSSLTQRIVEFLRNNGHEVVLEDLDAQHFDPVMTEAERASYYDGPYTTGAIADYVERLRTAEAIVLIFPTWWFGPPAILKGWLDRVWGPGVAYDHSKGYGPIKARLHDLREMLVVTTLGASWWVDRLILRQPVRRILKTAIVGTCAPKCRFQMLSMYKCESLTPAQVEAFWSRIQRVLSRWQARC